MLTGSRLEQAELYQTLFEAKAIKKSELKSALEWLEGEERLVQQNLERRRVERNVARRQRRAEKRASNVIVDLQVRGIDFDTYRSTVIDGLRGSAVKLVGQKHAWLQISVDGQIVSSGLIDVRGGDATAIFWNNIYPQFHKYEGGEETDIFLDNRNKNVRFVILKSETIPSRRIQQKYRDGNVHCVLEPLAGLWETMMKNCESKSAETRCRQTANKLRALESVYPNGVPESDMEYVAKIAHRCIVIHDIIGSEITRYNAHSNKFFHFTNTRVNHLETGMLTLDKQYEPVSQERMYEILAEHDEANHFYLFTGDVKSGKCQSLRSIKGAWAVFNEDYDLFKEFSTKHGIQNYGLEAVKFQQLNEFVRESRIINSAPTPLCDTPNDLENVHHIDIQKAYTQHAKHTYYQGFLGHITHWRKLNIMVHNQVQFLESHLGIYQFSVVKNTCNLLKLFGLREGCKYTLPSPELLYFIKEFGLEVVVLAGCWGSKFDIHYDDEMLNQRRYCLWAGKLGMDSDVNTYTFKGNIEWASHLKAVLGDDNVLFYKENGIIVVKLVKKSYFTTHHILSFITSYTRLNMFDIMRKIEDKNLVKVVLDGIYFRGEVPDVTIPHSKNKDLKVHLGFRDAWYYPSDIDTSNWSCYNMNLDDGSCILAGAGGTGKSFSVLTDRGIISPLYVVPSHLLGRKCRDNYGVNYTTIHKLVGIDCRPFKESNFEPGVVFIDELTMIEESWVKKAIEMYPNTLFYIAGDIDSKQWFQCRSGFPGQFSKIWIPSDWRYVYYTNDMRSRDNELKKLKEDLRCQMRKVFTDGGQFDSIMMNEYLKTRVDTVSFDEACSMFQPGNIWIAGTHKTNKRLLDKGIVSGYINREKEICSEDSAGAEKRGSFTTHSFQGLTIEHERLFVSLDFFEYAMLYTSVSRVCNFNQLIIVR